MKTFIAATALFIAATATSACEYGDHDININFQNATPVESACDGAITAIKFFEQAGYGDYAFVINVTVADEVYTYMRDQDGNDGEAVRVFGLYDGAVNQITISALGTEYMSTRTAWNTDPKDDTSGMPITEEIWTSVITHEVAHALATQIYNTQNPVLKSNGYPIEPGVSEYIAYFIQLATTRPELRDEIVASFGDIGPFQYTENLNPFKHFAHPHKFGVQAYLTNNMDWFHAALRGEIRNDLATF